MEASKCKIVIVCGFLGAGKTTLIESILKAPALKAKIAVIQNEFSAQMGLESSLMKDEDGNEIDDFYEMPNGCICCSGKGDLINTLDTLLAKKHLEFVVVEMNGLADPSAIIQTFWVDDGLGSLVTLHQTVAIVDSKTFPVKLRNHKVAQEQIEESDGQAFTENELLLRQLVYADKILLNKVDLLKESDKDKELLFIRELITEVNPDADIVESVYANAALDFFTDKSDRKVIEKPLASDHKHDADCIHNKRHSEMADIQSIYVNLDNSDGLLFNERRLEKFLGVLLWEKANGQIMRCKGSLVCTDENEYLLQGVDDLFELRMLGKASHADKHRLLFVGRQLDEQWLINELKKCME